MMMTATIRFRTCALALLGVILVASVLIWPLPLLGFQVDTHTGMVVAVEPLTPADREGVQIGDRILAIYGFAWPEINTRMLIVPLPWHAGTPTPMLVQRDDATIPLILYADAPTHNLQFAKLIGLSLAITCWATGYILGVSPHATQRRLQWVAWFWLWLGVALSLYHVVHVTSYVLSVVVLWVLSTVLAPLSVLMHAWYPSRPRPSNLPPVWGWLAFGGLQVSMVVVALAAPSTAVLLRQLHTMTFFAFLASFFVSTMVLWRAYQTTTIAHIQRQIRLIAAACIIVGCWWALLIIGRALAPDVVARIPASVMPAAAMLIPLAYLVGGISPDLLRIDVVTRRIVQLMVAAVLLSGVILIAVQTGLIPSAPALSILLLLLGTPPACAAPRSTYVAAAGTARTLCTVVSRGPPVRPVAPCTPSGRGASGGHSSDFRQPAGGGVRASRYQHANLDMPCGARLTPPRA
jgi:hypothetical protein